MKPVAVIGHGDSGKTVLINRLLGKAFIKGHPITQGVELSTDKKNGIAYVDCGGQSLTFTPAIEPLKSLNPLFVVAYSIDADSGIIGGELKSWLEKKKIVDPENRSPTIVANTHCNTASGFAKPGRTTESREGISCFFNVDNKTGDGIKDLKDGIYDLAKTISDQEVTEEQFFYTNLAVKIIRAVEKIKKAKNKISISMEQFKKVLTGLKIKQKPPDVIKELEKLKLLIYDKKKDRLIFPLCQDYHLHKVSTNTTNPVMKIEFNDPRFIMLLLAIKFGDCVSDIDPGVICLSSDPKRKPHEVVIKIDNDDLHHVLVTGERGSELLNQVQREVLDFLRENNLLGISKVEVKCPCSNCAKDPPDITWINYSWIADLKASDPSKSYYCLNSSKQISVSDFATFDERK